jgi:hypothetical protein
MHTRFQFVSIQLAGRKTSTTEYYPWLQSKSKALSPPSSIFPNEVGENAMRTSSNSSTRNDISADDTPFCGRTYVLPTRLIDPGGPASKSARCVMFGLQAKLAACLMDLAWQTSDATSDVSDWLLQLSRSGCWLGSAGQLVCGRFVIVANQQNVAGQCWMVPSLAG